MILKLKEIDMNDYGGVSRAVREELETMTNKENYEKQTKQKPKDESFWQKLRDNILLLLNKAPK